MDGNEAQQPYNVWLDKVTSTAGYCMATAKVLHVTIWLTAVGSEWRARGRVSGWEGAMVPAEAESRFEVGSLQGGQVSALGFSYDCLSERVFGIGFDSSMAATLCCKCGRSRKIISP